ncbi:TadE/TadG family type IV pilus assembly protein [Roseomonas sp. AR75]|jgi:uncharacterized protein (UPF0333 family)|uniref:TadE/TadG family type IV pilus assembly protein n=1 Tax=Roseomonas sp. AR75 TaxID=2562311 RepID=UPI0010C076B4|nr:TadE/TadG family type IV pilus assembly protein [Roseomonas sp. AR75]
MPSASLDRRGSASVEFGLLMPGLLLLALGATDLVNFMRAQMRLDSAALQVGQLVTQCNRISSPGDTDQFWSYAQRIVGNLGNITGANASGAIILTAVALRDGASEVVWQHRSGVSTQASAVGSGPGPATLPGGFTVPQGTTLFVTEVYLPQDPWSLGAIFMAPWTQQTLRGVTYFVTRAPDAASLQLTPQTSNQPDCTG